MGSSTADVTNGNVAGSVLAFFLFNAVVIAMVHPVRVEGQVYAFYLPVFLLTVLLGTLFMARQRAGPRLKRLHQRSKGSLRRSSEATLPQQGF